MSDPSPVQALCVVRCAHSLVSGCLRSSSRPDQAEVAQISNNSWGLPVASRIPVCTERWALPSPTWPCPALPRGAAGQRGSGGTELYAVTDLLLPPGEAACRQGQGEESLFRKAWHLPTQFGLWQLPGPGQQPAALPSQTSEAPGGAVSGVGQPCPVSSLEGTDWRWWPPRDPEASQRAGAGQPPARSLLSQDWPSQEAPVRRSS